jgi:hypothetical protein
MREQQFRTASPSPRASLIPGVNHASDEWTCTAFPLARRRPWITGGYRFSWLHFQQLPAQRHVRQVWRKIEVLAGCQAEAGFVLGGWADINKLAHRMTGWETIRAADGINGDRGEMPARLGGCQQVGRQGCRRTARIPPHVLRTLGSLVAIWAEETLGVAALPCRPEQGVGKLGANEDHRNSALKSRNNKI